MIRTLTPLLLVAGIAVAQSPSPQGGPVFRALLGEARARIQEVTAAQLMESLARSDKPLVIDVREDLEWQSGHIPAAVHIGRGVLERDIESAVPQKDARIVVYCRGGGRSALAADTLQKMGYTRVVSLAGGLQAYQAAGGIMQR